MDQYERDFDGNRNLWVLSAVILIFLIFLILIGKKPNLFDIFRFFITLTYLTIYLFLIVYLFLWIPIIKRNYEHNKNNNLCDYCGSNLQKIKVRQYLFFKTTNCKKCHIKLSLIPTIFIELILFINFLIYFLYIPPAADEKYLQLGFIIYLISFSVFPIYSCIRILKY